MHEIGATPIHALCLPPPPNGPGDRSLNPTVLYTGDVSFGGSHRTLFACAHKHMRISSVLVATCGFLSYACACACVCVPGTLQNFGHCVVDGSGIATFSLRTTAGETLYELQLTPTNSC